MKQYFWVCVITVCIIVVGLRPVFDNMDNYHHWLKVFDYATWFPICVFIISAVVSAIYATYKLRSPGISSEVRFVILRRHIATIVFFTITNLYFINSMISYLRFGFLESLKSISIFFNMFDHLILNPGMGFSIKEMINLVIWVKK